MHDLASDSAGRYMLIRYGHFELWSGPLSEQNQIMVFWDTPHAANMSQPDRLWRCRNSAAHLRCIRNTLRDQTGVWGA